ncbi:MAG: flavodoxin-dependent (E)-4-hydroxy-3-methylbut-2-enyl-diphosphate synthase [Lachnospiraceae bacterium]|nr:flavodoxin-dependent (E)-4-hydroxy-3-methylbut-2-enyl-diphosphate synthase [Lachnospiraceae bacterium]
MEKRVSRTVSIGDRAIGGGKNILIQSMTNTRTEDAAATIGQILALERAGCDIVRCTVPNEKAAEAFREIKRHIHIPLVADIHFDYRMALLSLQNGADKIRINPGNIGGREGLEKVVSECSKRKVPIRVGVNSGSLEREIIAKYGGVTAEGLCESALNKVRLIEELGYGEIVISIKSSDVMMCVHAYEEVAKKTDYPLHIGITEAGTPMRGGIKSGVGLGILLYEGIGDTLRVSLTGDPVEEVEAAKVLLRSLDMYEGGVEVVSCPTCGRTKIDLISLAKEVEEMVRGVDKKLKVAVMGCAVNGPGEAREADLGVAGGDGEGLIFKKGEIIKKVPEGELLSAFKVEFDKLCAEK